MTDIRLYLASLVTALGLGVAIGAIVVTPDLVDSLRAGVAPRVTTPTPTPTMFGIPLPDAWDAEAELRYRQEIEGLRGEIDTLDMSLEDAHSATVEAKSQVLTATWMPVPTTPLNLMISESDEDIGYLDTIGKYAALVVAQGDELNLLYEQNDVLKQALEVATNRVDSLTGRKVRWGLGVTAGLPVVNRSDGANFTAVFGVTLMWG